MAKNIFYACGLLITAAIIVRLQGSEYQNPELFVTEECKSIQAEQTGEMKVCKLTNHSKNSVCTLTVVATDAFQSTDCRFFDSL